MSALMEVRYQALQDDSVYPLLCEDDRRIVRDSGFPAWVLSLGGLDVQPARTSGLASDFVEGAVCAQLGAFQSAKIIEHCGRVFSVDVTPVSNPDPSIPFMFDVPHSVKKFWVQYIKFAKLYVNGAMIYAQQFRDFVPFLLSCSMSVLEKREMAYFGIKLLKMASDSARMIEESRPRTNSWV